jgi:uncharacterized protein (TIGR03382 family)
VNTEHDNTPATETPPEAEDGTRTPEQIEAEIEATREELGETVSALAEKTDIKGQAQHRLEETKANPVPLAVAAGVAGLAAVVWLWRRRR